MQQLNQVTIEFPSWGGARKGAGRKPASDRSSVAHTARPRLAARYPLHITLRLDPGLPSLRQMRARHVVRDALASGACRLGLRLVHFVVLSNHLHLICEADDERALARGMQGLCVRIARALNRTWRRAGSVFADRYHAHVLKTPREVRNALKYLFQNARHHGIHFAGPDPFSSAAWFDGWHASATHGTSTGSNLSLATSASATAPRAALHPGHASPLPHARTWLLTLGWRRHGLIDPSPAVRALKGRRSTRAKASPPSRGVSRRASFTSRGAECSRA